MPMYFEFSFLFETAFLIFINLNSGAQLFNYLFFLQIASDNNNNGSSVKRSKSAGEDNVNEKDATKGKSEQNGGAGGDGKSSKDNNAKLPEAPKDYIHVRARRGQATDAHSLAERV